MATNFEVAEDETVGNINADLALAGKISGTINLIAGGTEASLVASTWLEMPTNFQTFANSSFIINVRTKATAKTGM